MSSIDSGPILQLPEVRFESGMHILDQIPGVEFDVPRDLIAEAIEPALLSLPAVRRERNDLTEAFTLLPDYAIDVAIASIKLMSIRMLESSNLLTATKYLNKLKLSSDKISYLAAVVNSLPNFQALTDCLLKVCPLGITDDRTIVIPFHLAKIKDEVDELALSYNSSRNLRRLMSDVRTGFEGSVNHASTKLIELVGRVGDSTTEASLTDEECVAINNGFVHYWIVTDKFSPIFLQEGTVRGFSLRTIRSNFAHNLMLCFGGNHERS